MLNLFGERVVFSSGSLRQAVKASCAVPGAFEPLKEGKRLLCDGGIICPVPVSVARREGADIVVAVRVEEDICSAEDFRNVKDIYRRAAVIMAYELEHYELQDADILIAPEADDLQWTDFSQAMRMVEMGERAAREKLPILLSKKSRDSTENSKA